MSKIVAIVGTYRKGGITEQAVDAVLKAAGQNGAETKKIYLMNTEIEFCRNCRTCTHDDPKKRYGKCVAYDDMQRLVSEIESADSLVFASPINFGSVTAVMKRFIERLLIYGYWPWDQSIPKNRVKELNKKAVVITSSATPAFIGRLLMPSALKMMRTSAKLVGARVVKALYFGLVCQEEKQKLNKKQLSQAEAAGKALA